MDKIIFEDGQLTKKGYVVIDDKEYLINEAQYDGATPLSAYILNKMQDNIEKAIGDVSSFDPVIVEELPTENIKEKTMYLVLSDISNTIKRYSAYIYKENEWKEIGSTDLTVNLIEKSYKVTLTEKVEAGGTITLPANYKVGSDRLDVFFNGEKLIKAIDDDSQGHYYEVGTEDMSSNTIKLTSDWFANVGDVFEFSIRTNGEGQAEEVVVDSIPIGTIIDYEGDTVPEGYEEVEDKGEVYSIENEITNTSSKTNEYLLKSRNKVVIFDFPAIYADNITENTWVKFCSVPNEIVPDCTVSTVVMIINAGTGNLVGFGKTELRTDGYLYVKSNVTVSTLIHIAGSFSWFIE